MAQLLTSQSAPPGDPRAHLVQTLTEQVRELEQQRFGGGRGDGAVLSCGLPAVDRLLPGGGLRTGTLVEWLGSSASGAGTLALLAACEALQLGGALVVIDRAGRFYPPAALAWGVPLTRLIVVRPTSAADEAWAVDQALRSRGVAAVWCALAKADEHTLRRWQLATESSGTLGLLLRDESAAGQPSWADLRLGVQPVVRRRDRRRARRLRIEVLRTRSGQAGQSVEVDAPAHFNRHDSSGRGFHHATSSLHLASSVAAGSTGRRARRA